MDQWKDLLNPVLDSSCVCLCMLVCVYVCVCVCVCVCMCVCISSIFLQPLGSEVPFSPFTHNPETTSLLPRPCSVSTQMSPRCARPSNHTHTHTHLHTHTPQDVSLGFLKDGHFYDDTNLGQEFHCSTHTHTHTHPLQQHVASFCHLSYRPLV